MLRHHLSLVAWRRKMLGACDVTGSALDIQPGFVLWETSLVYTPFPGDDTGLEKEGTCLSAGRTWSWASNQVV